MSEVNVTEAMLEVGEEEVQCFLLNEGLVSEREAAKRIFLAMTKASNRGRPTVEDVLKIVTQPLPTSKIIEELQRQGFDIDKRYFWDHLAEGVIAAGCDAIAERKQ